MPQTTYFLKPTLVERVFNRLFGVALAAGLGLGHNYLVEVKGRKSGKLYATPVDLLELDGRRYLVAGRGATNWVRNARAAGHVALRKGGRRQEFVAREVAANLRPRLLKAYLDRFAPTVQRYFPVQRGAAESEFVSIADRYPVFELITPAESPPGAGGERG
jgi:deazaflavin-dependent oxidoreductase (nitroreductase family)